MRVLLQRCKAARVEVDGVVIGQITRGYTLLVGVTHEDTMEDAQVMAAKVATLRIFEDEHGKMNRSIHEVDGAAILSVSQFTLYGDVRKGRRPSFSQSANGQHAEMIYEAFNDALRAHQLEVHTGRFWEMMDVQLVNWGPVTFWLDSLDLPGVKKGNGVHST
jgi:D-tyrosyl-tRNA(Tyr) deacylase